MRTVHETEALRPSDPIPKSMQPANKNSSLKSALKPLHDRFVGSPDPTHDRDSRSASHPTNLNQYPDDLKFSTAELKRSPKELWRLLRRQLHWAEEEADALKRELEVVEAVSKKEWKEKELLLDQVVKNEIDWHERRQVVLAAEEARQATTTEEVKEDWRTLGEGSQEGEENARAMLRDIDMEMEEGVDQREAAAVLASLHQG